MELPQPQANDTMTERRDAGAVDWIDSYEMAVGDTAYVTLGDERVMTPKFHELSNLASTSERFVLQKPRAMIDAYVGAVTELAPKTILEFGIFKGGSVSLLSQLARPDKYVAVELAEERVDALDRWIEAREIGDSVKPYYGVSQDDTQRVVEIVETEFGDQPLDLVIDDASHSLEETRTTFNAMFPRLRPGGLYVIEDWALAGYLGFYTEEKPPLTNLMLEIVAAWSRNPDLFAKVEVDWFVVFIRRGDAEIDGALDIAGASSQRDRYAKRKPA